MNKSKLLDAVFPNFTCLACGNEIQDSANAYLCQDCIDNLPFYPEPDPTATHYAPFFYEEPIRSIVLVLKYSDNAFAARAVAPYMAAIYLKHLKGEEDHLIIPVPLCKNRFKERGYNQSELLGREVASYLGLPVMTDVLVRIKETPPQKNMTTEQRRENMKGAFAIPEYAERIKGRDILLVDDVYTSGATVGECSKVLLEAGAASVAILTIATVS